jgi:hypothetical protein
MAKVVYKVVEHDGGWAYSVDGAYSETFKTHDAAKAAARRAAREQSLPGDDVGIVYEDASGQWHEEVSGGGDRPETEVEG